MKRIGRILLNALLLVTLITPAGAAPLAQASTIVDPVTEQESLQIEAPLVEATPEISPPPTQLGGEDGITAAKRAVIDGTYPAQIVGTTGNVQPTQHGPQRNDPAEGIPDHACSPFDERNNREHPCPPGGCDTMEGQVLIKFAPEVGVDGFARNGMWTQSPTLNQALAGQGIEALDRVFPGAQTPRRNAMVVTPGGDQLPEPDLTRWYRAKVAESTDVYEVVDALQQDPQIAYAEPDFLRKPVGGAVPKAISAPAQAQLALPGPGSDPLYSQQWHLDAANVSQAWQWLEDEGYEPGGSRDVVVAVIDTGVDYTHPDLMANMWVNAPEFAGSPGVDDDGNGYTDDIYGADTVYPDGDPQDDHGHGTHVAGIIAMQADNGIGGVGVAYNVQIMALKAAQYSGVLATSDIAEAIFYAVEKGADVINMSFGGYARSQIEEDALAVAFGQAVLVAAAGNDGKVNQPCFPASDMYPAAHNWVLGVMASTNSGNLAGFSNSDCIPHDSHEYELMAPGVDVWSTLPEGGYAAWDGTSMAAPVVSGIATLLRTKWSDKDIYSSRFIMGQIASNASPVADAYAALTVAPKPELHYLEHWLFDTAEQSAFNDDDGIVDAGEIVDLAIVIRNHWGKADPVTVTLEAWAEGAVFPDPYAQIISDTVSYGAIGSFNWDDNGLIYDNNVVVGVEHPFRFTVPINAPNDHVIPFLLTMTAGNGYAPDDPSAPYVSQSRFYLIVQRGRELPRVIDEDMVLTKDYYWLVPDQTLIEPNISVTVTEGAQLQFWSIDPQDPYSQDARPYLQVEGELLVQGSMNQPVELFNSKLYPGFPVDIRSVDAGRVSVSYTRLINPQINIMASADTIDHCYITQELADGVHHETGLDYEFIYAPVVSHSIFRGLGGWLMSKEYLYANFGQNQQLSGNLFDSNRVILFTTNGQGNVFLGNRKIAGGGTYYPSAAHQIGYECSGCDELTGRSNNLFRDNAFLNAWWDPDISKWMRITTWSERGMLFYITDNYWNPRSTTLIDATIHDYLDDFNLARYIYEPILESPPETSYPFVTDVTLSTTTGADVSIVGAELVTFTATFNRDMDTTLQPSVSFGPDVPETDYTVHPVNGGWQDPRTWTGASNITPITGDGYQLMRIAGAVAVDDPWLVTGVDVERFRFEIITSGTEAMNLQATGGEGYVDLSWTQDDFDLLSGFNLYRSTSQDGTYTRINASIIPPDQRTYRDTDVQPGQPYYYKFTIVKSDMTESDFSNVATAMPIDTIAPTVSHTPVTQAPPGLALTLFADVTDNVAVQGVTLYYRVLGGTTYTSRAMAHTTGDRYSATIEGSTIASPGLEYYIEASDGVGTASSGRASVPHQILVVDQPVITSVSPNQGPVAGGTAVTLSGSNFKAGATATFGGAVAANVTVQSSTQLTCTTPPHFPETVDVVVTNPDDQSGTRLLGFTYESDTASVGLPDVEGGRHAIIQVPVNVANVQGLAAADLTVTYDAAVLSAQGASLGNLTPGWSLATNTGTSGQIQISMASGGGTVTGAGVLVTLEFEVVGDPGATSDLQLASLSFNDGAIPVLTSDGTFMVSLVYNVSGTIGFWSGSTPVSGTLLTMDGDRIYAGTSNATGAYTVAGVPEGDYTLTPSKSDEPEGISAYDASLALQHAAGLNLLSGYAATAADVNRNSQISSMDAFYILQRAAGLIQLPFTGAGRVWDFSPQTRSYTGLAANQAGQNFTAILLGDISGNWAPPEPAMLSMQPAALTADVTATLTLADAKVLAGELVTIPLTLSLAQGDLYAADLTFTYNSDVVTITTVAKGDLIPGWSAAVNTSTPGVVRVAVAGATPVQTDGELLEISFRAIGATGESSPVTLTRGDLNEGAIPSEFDHGVIEIAYPVTADFTATPTSGTAPLTVVFTNTSTGDYTSLLWDFGDGDTSTLTDPTHIYAAPGTYTVTLTAQGSGGIDVLERANFINAGTINIAGAARFWRDNTGIPTVTVSLTGADTQSKATDLIGAYSLTGLLAGDYEVTPTKADGVQGISAYDASLVLQNSAGSITLAGYAAAAADVDSSSVISSMDASYILQKAVDLISVPFPGSSEVWEFTPVSLSYTDLRTGQSNQDFTGVLIGDVSGSWSQYTPLYRTVEGQAEIRVLGSTPDDQGFVTAEVELTPTGGNVYGIDLVLIYDPARLELIETTTHSLGKGDTVLVNTEPVGSIRVGLASPTAIQQQGTFLTLRLKLTDTTTSASLTPTWGQVNEGAVDLLLSGTTFRGGYSIYLPCVIRATDAAVSSATMNRTR